MNANLAVDMKVRLVHLAKKIPGFKFSSYQTTMDGSGNSDVLVSMERAEYMLDCIRLGKQFLPTDDRSNIPPANFDNWISLNSKRRVPKSRLFIKLNETATKRSRSMLKSELRLYLADEDLILDRVSTE